MLDAYRTDAAHVVGASMGGIIGQLLALDHRDRLRTLTVMITAALDVDVVGKMQRAFAGQPSPGGLPTPNLRVVGLLQAMLTEPATNRGTEFDRRVAVWRALAGGVLAFDPQEFRRWEERAIDHAVTSPWPPPMPWLLRCR